MNKKRQFGLLLQAIRKTQGLSQEELAAKIGRSPDALSNIERGMSFPSFEMLAALSETLSVEPNELFEDFRPNVSSRHLTLLAKLSTLAKQLGESDLQLAVAQLEAIVARAKAR